MTVAELVAALQALPQDAQVFSDADGDCVGVVEMEGDEVALRGYPRESVNPWVPPDWSRSVFVPPGATVAEALKTAKPGDVLVLQPGHVEPLR